MDWSVLRRESKHMLIPFLFKKILKIAGFLRLFNSDDR